MNKKVGLVTCYVNNYGACLQAYALQTIISSFGCDCEILQYTPVPNVKKYGVLKSCLNRGKDMLRLIKIPHYSYTVARKKKFDLFRKKYLHMSSQNFLSTRDLYKKTLPYDTYVTGSDQIWNPLIHNNRFDEIYMLDFVKDGAKRIAYAPSVGIESIPAEFQADMKRYLEKFDVLSAREQSGADIVTSLVDKPCRVVLDPTLLINRKRWMEIASYPLIEKPYIFCYTFGEQVYINELINQVKARLQMKTIIIPLTDSDFSRPDIKLRSVGPFDFVSLISNAALVITDSFHATAFSINLNTPFYSCLRNTQGEKNNMNTRITNILNITGLEDRLISSESEFPDDFNIFLDFTQANKKLSEKRDTDLYFLKKQLLD